MGGWGVLVWVGVWQLWCVCELAMWWVTRRALGNRGKLNEHWGEYENVVAAGGKKKEEHLRWDWKKEQKRMEMQKKGRKAGREERQRRALVRVELKRAVYTVQEQRIRRIPAPQPFWTKLCRPAAATADKPPALRSSTLAKHALALEPLLPLAQPAPQPPTLSQHKSASNPPSQ